MREKWTRSKAQRTPKCLFEGFGWINTYGGKPVIALTMHANHTWLIYANGVYCTTVIIETPVFTGRVLDILSVDEYKDLQSFLAADLRLKTRMFRRFVVILVWRSKNLHCYWGSVLQLFGIGNKTDGSRKDRRGFCSALWRNIPRRY